MKKSNRNIFAKVLGALGFILFILILTFPFVWQFITSIRHPADINLMPPELIPHRISAEFYKIVFTQHEFGKYLLNSLIVASGAVLIGVFVAIPASYAFVRIHFTGKKFWGNFVLCANMFPIIAVATPLFVTFKSLNLINTYAGLIIPSLVLTLPVSVWTLNAFLVKIPIELEHAAMIDGASRFEAVWRVILPLMAPGIFTTAIIAFIGTWNEFMFAMIFVTKKAMRTVPVAIALMPGEFTLPWGDMAAASIVATMPIVLVVILCQKKIVSGLTAGAVKG